MLHIDMTFADTRLIAGFKEDEWHVKIHDNLSGESAELRLSGDEMGAMAFLIIAGDDTAVAETLYGIVGKKIDHIRDLPANLRPIP